MKILLFVRSLEVGGTQRQLTALAAGLARRGHEIAIAVFYPDGPNAAALAESNVSIVNLGKAGRWDIFAPLYRLRQLMQCENFDIVYSFLPAENSLTAIVAPRAMRGRHVMGVRAAGMRAVGHDLLSDIAYRLEIFLSPRAAAIITNAASARVEAIKLGMPAERIVAVPNGIDTQRIKPDNALRGELRRRWNTSAECFLVGLVARFDPMKDHETFLKAAADFAQRERDARFVCVGSGPTAYRENLEARAKSLGLAERLVWAGEIGDARLIANAFDIATLSSVAEGFSNVICEAMACGVPVAATDVGDNAAIIGRFGEIVPPRRPDLLSAAWARLRRRLADEPKLGEMARGQIASRYGLDAMVDATEKILERVRAGQPAGEDARLSLNR